MAGPAVPYVPLDAKPWRLTMGLRPLDPARWLEVDRHRPSDLRRKAHLLAVAHDTVMAALPGSEVPGRELLDAVAADLAEHHPGRVERRPDGRFVEHDTEVVVDPAGRHPVETAARLVQEDLCVMVSLAGTWVLTAGCVCFPSRWRLPDKIGRDLSAIHAPVPGYADSLAVPTAAFFDRLRPERPMWRANWTLLDTPELHLPEPEGRRGLPGEALWFRVERQTLRQLAGSGATVFTIRTYVSSMADLVAAHPEAVPALRATLPTVPPPTVDYKGWSGMIEPLVAWLSELDG
jgi:dimethylamine monooxygenase subunit A